MEPKDWLDFYYKKYKEINFKIAHGNSKGYWKWNNYKGDSFEDFIKEHTINNREIFPDEVVVDIDGNHYKWDFSKKEEDENKQCFNEILKRLTDYNNNEDESFGFYGYHSGNKGYHIHMFFPELNKHPVFLRNEIKKMIVRKFAKGYLQKKEGRSHVDLMRCHSGLIQLEDAPHRKGFGWKTMVAKLNTPYGNKIPKDVIAEINAERAKIALRKEMLRPDYFDVEDKPYEIKLLETEDFVSVKDGRKRALFVLIAYYHAVGLNYQQVLERMYEWNDYNLHSYLSRSKIEQQVGYVFKRGIRCIPMNYVRGLLDELGVKVKGE